MDPSSLSQVEVDSYSDSPSTLQKSSRLLQLVHGNFSCFSCKIVYSSKNRADSVIFISCHQLTEVLSFKFLLSMTCLIIIRIWAQGRLSFCKPSSRWRTKSGSLQPTLLQLCRICRVSTDKSCWWLISLDCRSDTLRKAIKYVRYYMIMLHEHFHSKKLWRKLSQTWGF